MSKAKVNQLKTRIFLLQATDTVLIIALATAAIYSVFYSDQKETMIIACLVGLFLVNTLGRFTHNKVNQMRVQVSMLEREMKTVEQRTLMATRHATVGGTRATGVKTTATNPTTAPPKSNNE